MTDKELLTLAAKAAGIEGEWRELTNRNGGTYTAFIYNWGGGTAEWRPLTDDGDALRLAVKLKLDTNCKKFATACSWFPHTTKHDVVVTHDGSDPYAATRRAIVRAAAAIGAKP